MAYKMSLDYPLAKRFLKAMDNLIDPEIADKKTYKGVDHNINQSDRYDISNDL